MQSAPYGPRADFRLSDGPRPAPTHLPPPCRCRQSPPCPSAVHRADSGLILRLGVAVHPVGDTLLVSGIEPEELLARELVHLCTPVLCSRRPGERQAAEYEPYGYQARDPIVSHMYLQWLKVLLLLGSRRRPAGPPQRRFSSNRWSSPRKEDWPTPLGPTTALLQGSLLTATGGGVQSVAYPLTVTPNISRVRVFPKTPVTSTSLN